MVKDVNGHGELNQLENHLNPQPTTVENLLEGCQFEILHFKWKHYEVKPQAELHTQQLRDFKAVIVCCVIAPSDFSCRRNDCLPSL